MVSDAIYARLAADADTSAIVSDRIYPVIAKQGTGQPFITFTIDTAERQVTYGGTHDLVQADLEVNCYGRSYKTIQDLAAAVRASLLDFSGLMQADTSPITYVRFSAIHLQAENDLQDEEPGLHRKLQRFTIWYYD